MRVAGGDVAARAWPAAAGPSAAAMETANAIASLLAAFKVDGHIHLRVDWKPIEMSGRELPLADGQDSGGDKVRRRRLDGANTADKAVGSDLRRKENATLDSGGCQTRWVVRVRV